jgi:hypothetical protein
MLRLTMILLCLMLAAAAAGRYQAEAAVRETRAELRRLDHEKSAELTKIKVLRAEIAYLESPDRLAAIAEKMTDLKPLSGAQLLSAQDFEVAFNEAPAEAEPGRKASAAGAYEVAAIDGVASR